jgi:hypothetical protein
VFEVVAEGHALGMSLGGPLEPFVGRQRPLALTGPFPVDQAEDGGADAAEVLLGGPQVGTGTGAGDVAGRYVPLGEATDRGPSRRSHDGKQSHGERYDEPVGRHPLPRARAVVAEMARIIKQQQKRGAEGSHPHNHNPFRWPTGLADGLALKEPALPTASP